MLFSGKEKALHHKEIALIGFVLAVITLLSNVIIAYGVPLLIGFLRIRGLSSVEPLIFSLALTFFLSINGLTLFAFPLFYAQDQKSHMTGFRILLHTWFFLFILSLLTAFCSIVLS